MRIRRIPRFPNKSAQAGFSLIEIIVVVVLIGGIVAFAASKILGGQDRANVNLAKAQVQTLAEKIQQYQMDTGTLPGSLGDLAKAPADANGWLGPYAKDAEFNDPWKQPYTYKVPGENAPFDLVSLGADRKVGGTSVNADIPYQ
ncbi:MAG: type II secretion system major pseudopilin GspG [Thermomonas sp.]